MVTTNQNNPLKKLEERQAKRQKQMEDTFQERMRQNEQMRHNLDMEISGAVSGSGLSKDAYAIREVLLMVNRDPNKEFYQPSLYQIGFPQNIASIIEAHNLFLTLKKRGCFNDVERSGNEHLTLKGVNRRRLKREFCKLKNIEQSWLENFFRLISHGFIGVKEVLAVIVATLTIITLGQAIKSNNLREQVQELENQQVDKMQFLMTSLTTTKTTSAQPDGCGSG